MHTFRFGTLVQVWFAVGLVPAGSPLSALMEGTSALFSFFIGKFLWIRTKCWLLCISWVPSLKIQLMLLEINTTDFSLLLILIIFQLIFVGPILCPIMFSTVGAYMYGRLHSVICSTVLGIYFLVWPYILRPPQTEQWRPKRENVAVNSTLSASIPRLFSRSLWLRKFTALTLRLWQVLEIETFPAELEKAVFVPRDFSPSPRV